MSLSSSRVGLVGIAAQHLGDAARVVEADEHVGDDEAALGKPAARRPGIGTVGSSFATKS